MKQPLSTLERDRLLRTALDFGLQHAVDGTAMCALFGALATLVESPDDLQALELAQRGILGLLGALPAGSTLTNSWTRVETSGKEPSL